MNEPHKPAAQPAKPAAPATTAAKPADGAAKPAAKPKEPPKPKEPASVAGHPRTAVITLGVNKEGKKYGPDNNPKRANSAAASRFANYRDGMTIDQAIKAGVRTDDIGFDSDSRRNFITIK